jgi:hypothetical protein
MIKLLANILRSYGLIIFGKETIIKLELIKEMAGIKCLSVFHPTR